MVLKLLEKFLKEPGLDIYLWRGRGREREREREF